MTECAPPPYLADLNPEQQSAVLHGDGDARADGPLLVIAGAGTGKTSTLAHRVAHLVRRGVAPERILLLTFSRRAAREMVQRATRIAAAAGGSGSGRFPWSGTFHSVGNRIVRIHARQLGVAANYSVLDRSDAADLMDVVRQTLDLGGQAKRFPRKDTCLEIYSRCVNSQTPLEGVVEERYPWCTDFKQELRRLFRAYTEAKQEQCALDYDDLLLYWYHLMRVPQLAAAVSERFDHVLVDEYQDTNLLQAEIVRALRPDGRGVTAVGDDAQSIYSFRAADVENILRFPGSYEPPARVVKLERNYRSTQPILDSANQLMRQSRRRYHKDLYAEGDRAAGARPQYVTVEDEQAQVGYVVERILAAREAGTALQRQAVLFRNAHHSDALELELTRRNIPYVKYGGLKFLEAAHVKDLLAVLRWADNPRNKLAAFRVLQLMPGVGPAIAARCFDALAVGGFRFAALEGFAMPPAASTAWVKLLALLRQATAREAHDPGWHVEVALARDWYQPLMESIYATAAVRAGDLDQLAQIAGGYLSREQFLTELTLDPPAATGDLSGPPLLDEDFLILSTVHSAKGQEWDAVYLLNVADGAFPSEFATGREEHIEEERRLLYVAMTRARRELHLLAPLRYYVPQQRRGGDRHVYGARSRFVSDALLASFDRRFHPPSEGATASQSDGREPAAFDVAERIRQMW